MMKWFADGKVMVPFGRFLGYDRGEDGKLVINEEQAKIVREIYRLFLQVLMQSRGRGNNRNSYVSIFSNKIQCGNCGGWYGSKV